MLDVNAPFQQETIQNINESVNGGLSYHRINNMKYLYYVFLVNANGNYVQLTPEGVKFLEIDDSILEYSLSGTVIIQNDNEMLERTSYLKLIDQAVGEGNADLDFTDFFFRNDCRDYLYIYIKPDLENPYDMGKDVDNVNPDNFTLRGLFSVISNEDIVTESNPGQKLKKLRFVDSQIEMLREKNISFSTSNYVDSNNIEDLDDENRQIFTGDAIKLVLKEGLEMGSKGETDHSDLVYFDASAWNVGTSTIFYSSPGEHNVLDDLEYLLNRHTSSQPPFDFCLLRKNRYTKLWSLISMKSIFDNAVYQNNESSSGGLLHNELIVLGNTTEDGQQNNKKHKNRVPLTNVNNISYTDYSSVDNYNFTNMFGLDAQTKLVTTAVHSYQLNDKQFQIDLTNNSANECFNVYYDTYVRGASNNPYPLFVSENKNDIYSNIFLNDLRRNNINMKSSFSINDKEPDQRLGQGRNKFLQDAIYLNNKVELTLKGMTFRQSSRFFSFERAASFIESKVDDKIFGTYLAVMVKHTFVGETYTNKLLGAKTYLYGNPEVANTL